jgi:hypothetical protein
MLSFKCGFICLEFLQDRQRRTTRPQRGVFERNWRAEHHHDDLGTPHQLDLAARRIPELPGDHAGTMPDRILVGTGVPKVNVPA